jgi:capsule assembly protein Wzi
MLQFNRVTPFKLPSILGVLGPIRVDYFVGRLSGYHWLFSSDTGYTGSWTQSLANQPFIIGQKVSLKPTDNLELGIGATSLAGGTGVPFNLHKLGQAMFASGNGNPGTSGDPGDRRGAFDFAYKVPKLRDWLTFYGDAFTEDEVNPWVSWDKAAITSGMYLSHVPKIPKLDFRAEGIFTDLPGGTAVVGHGFFYQNSRFRSGYTNEGNLIGSWIGRQGQGAQAWTNYWFTPNSKLQLRFRHEKISQQFIPSGGSLTDFAVSSDFWVHSTFGVSASVQYERWLVPVIQPNSSRNITAAVQLTFKPSNWTLRPASHQP